MHPIVNPYQFFTDLDGGPLENGYIWVGTSGLNPETNPAPIYWDSAGLIPAAQPIRTLNGTPSRSGKPATIYTPSNYSITIRNRNRRLVASLLDAPPDDGKANREDELNYSGTHDFTNATLKTKRFSIYEDADDLAGIDLYKLGGGGALGSIIEMTSDGLVLRSFSGVAGSENEGVRLRLSFAGKIYRSSDLGVTDYEIYDAGNAPPGPPGTFVAYAGGTVPNRCLACPASPTLLLRADYPALFAALGAERWRGSAGAAPSDSFYMPYFPDLYTIIKAGAAGAVGELSIGQVINHVHPYDKTTISATGSGDTSGGQIGGYSNPNTGNPTSGAGSNYPAGMKVLMAVVY